MERGIRLLKLHDGVEPLVVAPKQGERERNVFFAMQVETDPPRVRYVMVRRDFAAGNEFIAHRAREREISHRFARLSCLAQSHRMEPR